MKSLDNMIWEAKHGNGQEKLTENQIDLLVSLLGHKCRTHTKDKLHRRLSLPLSLFKTYGIYSRLDIDEKSVEYTPGQDYGSEITTLRQCILD